MSERFERKERISHDIRRILKDAILNHPDPEAYLLKGDLESALKLIEEVNQQIRALYE